MGVVRRLRARPSEAVPAQLRQVAQQGLTVRPLAGAVALDLDDELAVWLDPSVARTVAADLLRAADQAELLAALEAATCQPKEKPRG